MSDTEEYISPQQLQEVNTALSSQDEDTRWQAAIVLGAYSETDPEAIWPLTVKHGSSNNEDTQTAIATCVLEHILVPSLLYSGSAPHTARQFQFCGHFFDMLAVWSGKAAGEFGTV